MAVRMVMTIERQSPLRAFSEQGAIFGRRRHMLGMPLATDMAIEADHAVAGAHDDMKVVADHEHGATCLLSHGLDLTVELGCARLVEPLRRFVENEHFRRCYQGACKEHAL